MTFIRGALFIFLLSTKCAFGFTHRPGETCTGEKNVVGLRMNVFVDEALAEQLGGAAKAEEVLMKRVIEPTSSVYEQELNLVLRIHHWVFPMNGTNMLNFNLNRTDHNFFNWRHGRRCEEGELGMQSKRFYTQFSAWAQANDELWERTDGVCVERGECYERAGLWHLFSSCGGSVGDTAGIICTRRGSTGMSHLSLEKLQGPLAHHDFSHVVGHSLGATAHTSSSNKKKTATTGTTRQDAGRDIRGDTYQQEDHNAYGAGAGLLDERDAEHVCPNLRKHLHRLSVGPPHVLFTRTLSTTEARGQRRFIRSHCFDATPRPIFDDDTIGLTLEQARHFLHDRDVRGNSSSFSDKDRVLHAGALPPLRESETFCYADQESDHQIRILTFVEHGFCATHAVVTPTSTDEGEEESSASPDAVACEKKVKEVLDEVSTLFENQLNIKLDARSIRFVQDDPGACTSEHRSVRLNEVNQMCADAVSALSPEEPEYAACPYLSACSPGWDHIVPIEDQLDAYERGVSVGKASRGGLCASHRASGGQPNVEGRSALVAAKDTTALVLSLAHQIGHLFGANHDDGGDALEAGIMAETTIGLVKHHKHYYIGFSPTSIGEMCARIRFLMSLDDQRKCITSSVGERRRMQADKEHKAPPPLLLSRGCFDKRDDCAIRANDDQCMSNSYYYLFMREQCPFSCELCNPMTGSSLDWEAKYGTRQDDVDITEPDMGEDEFDFTTGTTTTTLSAMQELFTVSSVGCMNKDENCQQLADVGQCEEGAEAKPWMEENCPLSCLLCDPVMAPFCEDRDPHCDKWAVGDFCYDLESYRFMNLHCPLSCGVRGPYCFPSGGGMAESERDAVIADGHTDDPNRRARHSNNAYYALPSLAQTSRRCYTGQDIAHKVLVLAFMDGRFCDVVANGVYAQEAPTCEEEVRKLMMELSGVFENQLNIRLEVARVLRLSQPEDAGCDAGDADHLYELANITCERLMVAHEVEYGLCPLFSGCPQGWVLGQYDEDEGETDGDHDLRYRSKFSGKSSVGGLCGYRGHRAIIAAGDTLPIFYTAVHEIGHTFGALHSTGNRHTRGFMDGASSSDLKFAFLHDRFYYGFSEESVDQMCARVEHIKTEQDGACLFADEEAGSMAASLAAAGNTADFLVHDDEDNNGGAPEAEPPVFAWDGTAPRNSTFGEHSCICRTTTFVPHCAGGRTFQNYCLAYCGVKHVEPMPAITEGPCECQCGEETTTEDQVFVCAWGNRFPNVCLAKCILGPVVTLEECGTSAAHQEFQPYVAGHQGGGDHTGYFYAWHRWRPKERTGTTRSPSIWKPIKYTTRPPIQYTTSAARLTTAITTTTTATTIKRIRSRTTVRRPTGNRPYWKNAIALKDGTSDRFSTCSGQSSIKYLRMAFFIDHELYNNFRIKKKYADHKEQMEAELLAYTNSIFIPQLNIGIQVDQWIFAKTEAHIFVQPPGWDDWNTWMKGDRCSQLPLNTRLRHFTRWINFNYAMWDRTQGRCVDNRTCYPRAGLWHLHTKCATFLTTGSQVGVAWKHTPGQKYGVCSNWMSAGITAHNTPSSFSGQTFAHEVGHSIAASHTNCFSENIAYLANDIQSQTARTAKDCQRLCQRFRNYFKGTCKVWTFRSNICHLKANASGGTKVMYGASSGPARCNINRLMNWQSTAGSFAPENGEEICPYLREVFQRTDDRTYAVWNTLFRHTAGQGRHYRVTQVTFGGKYCFADAYMQTLEEQSGITVRVTRLTTTTTRKPTRTSWRTRTPITSFTTTTTVATTTTTVATTTTAVASGKKKDSTVWGSWSVFGVCNKSCGGGVRWRSKKCYYTTNKTGRGRTYTQVVPSFCPGGDLKAYDAKKCNTQSCGRSGSSNSKNRCADQHRNCRDWSKNGECGKNPSFMLSYCEKSCRRCRSTRDQTTCVDRNKYCRAWANRGECRKTPGYMTRNCKKSCHLCSMSGSVSEKVSLDCFKDGIRYLGYNLPGGIKKRIPSAKHCQDLCQSVKGCHFWTWRSSDKKCFLKNEHAEEGEGEGNKPDRVSGPKRCPRLRALSVHQVEDLGEDELGENVDDTILL